MVYRDRLDIVRNLLEGVNNNNNNDDDIQPLDKNYISKTRLGFIASLTHAQTTTYLDELLDRGLIIERQISSLILITKSQKEGAGVWNYSMNWMMI
jgi:predicted transcriptional regulator